MGAILGACTFAPSAGSCESLANAPLTAFRMPDVSSTVFGTIGPGETVEALARTSDGWLGFDPGIAQAGNVGLAHHRWFQLNATLSPSCITDLPLVTLAEVQADIDASGG
jgi:hypothetical protein